MAESPTEQTAPDEHEQPTGSSDNGVAPDIDIEALAEKVYRLMLAEIRLDRARGLAGEQGG